MNSTVWKGQPITVSLSNVASPSEKEDTTSHMTASTTTPEMHSTPLTTNSKTSAMR